MPTSSTALAQFNALLTRVAAEKASDLHLTVGEPPTLRKSGALVSITDQPPLTQGFVEEVVASFLPDALTQELATNKEVTLAATFLKTIRFRINVFYQKGFLSASFRLVSDAIPALSQLGVPPIFHQWTEKRKGLVLVAGPFGAGKSTSVASFIEAINQTRQSYIITIEHPIEYVFHSMKSMVVQREVGIDVPSIAAGLEFLKSEDVDVVMISELADSASLVGALELASAGRLVISTLNATSVVRAVEKIRSSFPHGDEARLFEMLSENLLGIMAQLLVPRLGGGSVLVSEVLTMTPAVVTNIREGKLYQLQSIIQTSRDVGMVSLERSLAELVKTNEISRESAHDYSNDDALFNAALAS